MPEESVIYKLDTGQDPGFMNNFFFYSNILWYLVYCSFITASSFGDIEWSGYEFKEVRDFCVEGAFYEVQNATKLK